MSALSSLAISQPVRITVLIELARHLVIADGHRLVHVVAYETELLGERGVLVQGSLLQRLFRFFEIRFPLQQFPSILFRLICEPFRSMADGPASLGCHSHAFFFNPISFCVALIFEPICDASYLTM